MMRLSRFLFLIVALPIAGCGSSSSSPAKPAEPAPASSTPTAVAPEPVPACDQVVARLTEMMRAQMAGSVPEQQRAMMERMMVRMDQALLASCAEDGWSDDMKRCIVAAQSDEELDACGSKGGEELSEKIRVRIEPIIEETMKEMAASAPADQGAVPETTAPETPAVDDAAIAATKGPSGMAACDAYAKTAKSHIACTKVAKEARDTARKALEAAKKDWKRLKDPNTSVDDKKAAALACIQAETALRDEATAAGCKL